MDKIFYFCLANIVAHLLQVADLEGLRGVVEGYLTEFNNMSKKPMNLVMFKYVLSNVTSKALAYNYINHEYDFIEILLVDCNVSSSFFFSYRMFEIITISSSAIRNAFSLFVT